MVDVEIKPDGTPTFSSNPDDLVEFIQTWELERLILRQDEVASFIQKTKGVKYSVLLPLLGLANLERATENIRGLRRSVEDESKLAMESARLNIFKQEASKYFHDLTEETVVNVLTNIAKDYIKDELPTEVNTPHSSP